MKIVKGNGRIVDIKAKKKSTIYTKTVKGIYLYDKTPFHL